MSEIPCDVVERALRLNCCAAEINGRWMVLTKPGLDGMRNGYFGDRRVGLVVRPKGVWQTGYITRKKLKGKPK